MNRSEIPHWPTESSTGWCTTRIASRCVGTPCVKRKERRRKSECIGGPKAVEKTGERRPWKSQERFPLSHSFNNNKLDDRDHFQQNAKTSVASLRGLIGSSRNTDRHHSGMLIDFIGIPTHAQNDPASREKFLAEAESYIEKSISLSANDPVDLMSGPSGSNKSVILPAS